MPDLGLNSVSVTVTAQEFDFKIFHLIPRVLFGLTSAIGIVERSAEVIGSETFFNLKGMPAYSHISSFLIVPKKLSQESHSMAYLRLFRAVLGNYPVTDIISLT